MIKKPNGYDDAPVYGNNEKLSLGGHICKIKTARVDNYEWGGVLILAYDIAEGSQYDGFYERNYRLQQENKKWKGTYRVTIPPENPTDEKSVKTVSIFKTAMTAIEESNPGYKWNWDESSLKGKLFGGVFGRKEYDFNNRHGFYVECRYIRTVEEVKNGVDVPEDKLLNTSNNSPSSASHTNGSSENFESIPTDDDLPF